MDVECDALLLTNDDFDYTCLPTVDPVSLSTMATRKINLTQEHKSCK